MNKAERPLTFKLLYFCGFNVAFYWKGRFIFYIEVNSPEDGMKLEKQLREWVYCEQS